MSDPSGVLLASSSDKDKKTIPLIIRAIEGKDSVDYLQQWMKDNKEWLASKMLEHGECTNKGETFNSPTVTLCNSQLVSPIEHEPNNINCLSLTSSCIERWSSAELLH